jgi:D-alanyl-D-alanine carboxypeptidase/Putative peptidoglycan binding domain
MKLLVLRKGSTGEAVRQWQMFLIGEGFLNEVADGIFGPVTDEATRRYQKSKNLTVDGVVGSKTYSKAIYDDMAVVEDEEEFPPKPDFPPLLGTAARQKIFGKFRFDPAPTPKNKERIKIQGNWEKENIVSLKIDELKGIDVFGRPSSGRLRFHKKATAQLKGLWATWGAINKIALIQSYGGSFVPRFIRGSKETLSNHAFGSAFDINTGWNGLGKTPAPVGSNGSVRELVPIANDFGFYWGGHFKSRPDGMHFEVAKLLSKGELDTLNEKYGLLE